MQPALGKFSSAKVLVFEDIEEANSRKYPAQKFAAKEFISQFYNDGKVMVSSFSYRIPETCGKTGAKAAGSAA